LLDIRRTVAELINEVFFATMSELAKEKNCVFSSECVSPTMLSDGMLHYQQVDLPMGEYWLDSPTHDKPNDMADAIQERIFTVKISFRPKALLSSEANGMNIPVWSKHWAISILLRE
jgi:hypothetical protein